MFFSLADVVDDGREGLESKKYKLDASYTAIGSGFEEKDWGGSGKRTNKPVWEQEARDENGQRRFHGAFTGGFSAGYHNTVGSEEGWTPASFVSSRSSKAMRVEQTVDSFMDDEDRSEMLAEGLTATKKFNGFFTTADELTERDRQRKTRTAEGAVDTGDAHLVIPTHKTIGTYLLRKMGWKRNAHAPAKKTFGPTFTREEIEERHEELFREGRADDDDSESDDGFAHVVDVVPKNDHYGIGYDPSEAMPEYSEMKALRATMSAADPDAVRESSRKRKGALGSRLGLSVLEDDDDGDIYSQESRKKKYQPHLHMRLTQNYYYYYYYFHIS